jgi:hypothetical protein
MVIFNIESILMNNNSHMYWITASNSKYPYNYDYDCNISKLIGISTIQYQSEILQFSTDPPELQYYDALKQDVVFSKLEEVRKAKEFLQQKYELIFKLIS